MEINPKEMATSLTPQKPKLNWLHDFKNSFTDLDLVFRQGGFSGAKEYLAQSPIKQIGDYYSEERIKDFSNDFREGIRAEIYGYPYWVNLVDNQVYSLNQSKSPQEFQEALQKLKELF